MVRMRSAVQIRPAAPKTLKLRFQGFFFFPDFHFMRTTDRIPVLRIADGVLFYTREKIHGHLGAPFCFLTRFRIEITSLRSNDKERLFEVIRRPQLSIHWNLRIKPHQTALKQLVIDHIDWFRHVAGGIQIIFRFKIFDDLFFGGEFDPLIRLLER